MKYMYLLNFGNSFQCDVFKIEAGDLGKIFKVKVRHDNSSFFKSAWYLSKIEIKDPVDNEVYVFYCERWLAKNKDDGKIERSLYVKVKRPKVI